MTTHEVAIIVVGSYFSSLHLGNEFIPPPFHLSQHVYHLRQEMAMATWVFEPLVGRMTRLLWFHEMHEIHHFEFRCWCYFSADFQKKKLKNNFENNLRNNFENSLKNVCISSLYIATPFKNFRISSILQAIWLPPWGCPSKGQFLSQWPSV